MISRRHVRLTAKDSDSVEVSRYPTAKNPVFHRGQSAERFKLVPGDHFVIGRTTFTLANRPGASDASADEVTAHTYDSVALRKRHFRDAASRIEMLSRLPDLITSSGSEEELLVRVTGVLLQATPSASAVAVVAAEPGVGPEAASFDRGGSGGIDFEPVTVLHYDSRDASTEGPPISARLVRSAVRRRESVLHLWTGSRAVASSYTMSEEVDWAVCVPLRNEACPGWALYLTGRLPSGPDGDLGQSLQAAPHDLEDDVKFAELVGKTIANVRQGRRLERRQAAIRRFFAPVVMDALAGRDTDEVLAPREAELSVLFCDLRGFSRQSERDSEQLLELLARVSDALGVMTRHILATGGVIGDFHGDAAMGFWGWPLEQHDMASRAASAAMRIRAEYAANASENGFRCGIGIASGRAVAGRIGTVDQVKVTAFGPVVNLASRLEGITKAFGAEVIVDETTAAALRTSAWDPTAPYRLRRLASVRPAGISAAVEISELIATGDESDRALSQSQVADFEASLDAFIRGDWDRAYELLHALPAWDRPKDLLISTILRHNRVPPESWDGVIDLPKL